MLVLASLQNAESYTQMVGGVSREVKKPCKTKSRKKVKLTLRKRAVKLINKEYLHFRRGNKNLVNIKNRLVCEDLSEFVEEYKKHNLFFYMKNRE